MTITGGSALPKDEIDRMVKEAEAHAEEDKKRREDAEVRNTAEQTVYSMEKILKDESEKISDETANTVREDVDALKKALEGDDSDAVKTALDKLNESSMKIGQEVYAASQQEEAAGASEAGEQPKQESNSGDDDDVIDAEIVDDEEDK